MTDNARSRPRIAGQVFTPLGSSPMIASSSSHGQLHGQNGNRAPRAKVDVTNLGGPSRPLLRARASASSLRSQPSLVSSGNGTSRAVSPAPLSPPMPPPVPAITSGTRLRAKVNSGTATSSSTTPASLSSSGRESPYKAPGSRDAFQDPRPGPMARVRSAAVSGSQSTVPARQSHEEIAKGVKGFPSSMPKGEPLISTGDSRARVKLGAAVTKAANNVPPSESAIGPSSPLFSMGSPNRLDRSPSPVRSSISAADIASNRSSPRWSPSNLVSEYDPSIRFLPHPTASCPTSPFPGQPLQHKANTTRRHLPYNPHTTLPQPLPLPPDSPYMGKIELPVITPYENEPPSNALQDGIGSSSGLELDQHYSAAGLSVTLTSSGPVSDEGSVAEEPMLDVTDSGVEEARVNRKVADLEISNASLLAINKSLEATRARQSKEIARLRRALRESLTGLGPATSSNPPHEAEGIAAMSVLSGDTEEDSEDDALDPELEERWSRLQNMVAGMRRRGEAAVEKGKEETKVASQRVLGWLEVEPDSANVSMAGDETGTPEPEL